MKNGPSSPRSTNGSAVGHTQQAPRKRRGGSGGRAAPRRVPMARASAGARGSPRRAADHALAVLSADHARIAELFARAARQKPGSAQKTQLVARIGDELELHTRLEEELFYPSVRLALGASFTTHAVAEHAALREMVADLRGLAPADAACDAALATLRECVEQHVREEETGLFPRVAALELDLTALGRAMKTRRRQLRGEPGEPALAGLATFPGMIVT